MVDAVSDPEMRDLFQFMYGSGGPFITGEPGPGMEQPHNITDEERLTWDTALNQQPRYKQRTFDEVRAHIRARNRLRWRSMEKDFRWLQKEMVKMGLNPEDARFLL